MALTEFYRPRDNAYQAEYPGRSQVQLDANVSAGKGGMICVSQTGGNAGYGVTPSATYSNTNGVIAGVVEDEADNTGGAAGAATVTAVPGVYRFLNSGTHPCSQATVGAKVYASDAQTISTNSGDGPFAGTLKEFNASDLLGLPCKVTIRAFQ